MLAPEEGEAQSEWSEQQNIEKEIDGGTLADDVPVQLQEDELDEFRFVEPTALDDYLPPIISMRVAAAIRGRGTGTAAYLPWTEP